jgi:hypothetical protein
MDAIEAGRSQMSEALEASAIERWRRDATEFISEVLRDPETREPFILLDAEKRFIVSDGW